MSICLRRLSTVPLSQNASRNRISHIVYTSGTTGIPKGCISSIRSLEHYIRSKNEAHAIFHEAVVLLASALSFDPCLSDILATFSAHAALAIAPRDNVRNSLPNVLRSLDVTHCLCVSSTRLVRENYSSPSTLTT
jgi:acyl-coenzyme A synthetase/AMP-(fatty) acid ligase